MSDNFYSIQITNQNVQKALIDIQGASKRYTLPTTDLTNDEVMYNFAKSVFSDFIEKGYTLSFNKEAQVIKVEYPTLEILKPIDQKAFVRETLIQEKNDQLKKPTLLKFITSMETNRVFNKKWVSIFSLMRDGRELVELLKDINSVKNFNDIIDPYLQFIETGERCSHTGLLLNDIWRYFRYTWATPYKTVPGRNINILVRDAARRFHPIIGIASLGSSVIQQSERDKRIGWHGDVAIDFLMNQKAPGKWVAETIDRLLSEVYLNDLLKNNKIGLTKRLLRQPTKEIIEVLKNLKIVFLQFHRSSAKKKTKNSGKKKTNKYWRKEAERYLFKSKRCGLLAKLLECRFVLNSMSFVPKSKPSFKKAINNQKYKEVVERIVHLVKSEKVGINIMDIMVCGAIAPYNHILGGKLVSMMLVSPEVNQYYKNKYTSYSSEIASSMAGKAVKYQNDLLYLGVTSLYGVSSSQYNRLKIPLNEIGSKKNDVIKYEKIGSTLGFTSSHLSERTRELARILVNRFEGQTNENYSYVNYQFGEGTSPRLRLLNKALTIAGLDPSKLLKHFNPKIVYGIPLVNNLYEFLMGFNSKPIFYLNRKNPKLTTKKIAKYWANRWLFMRIKNKNVIENVYRENLAHPISHNAKVKMPKLSDEELGPLFSN